MREITLSAPFFLADFAPQIHPGGHKVHDFIFSSS